MHRTHRSIFRGGACLVALAILFALASCRREDWRVTTITLPNLTESDKPKIEAALGVYGGVDKSSYKFDYSGHTLTLRYDSMQVAQTNLRMAIEEKGVEVVYPEKTSGFAGYIDSRK